MPEILKHSDGTPKCVTSDYTRTRVWHYVTGEDMRPSGPHRTLCDRLIHGHIVGDRYAPEHGPNAGQPLPICRICASRRERLGQ